MELVPTNTALRTEIGPFVNYEDGVTPLLSLTVTNITCSMKVEKDDGSAVVRTTITLSASGGNNDMIHITDDTEGYYDLELTQAQLNFLGKMKLSFMDVDVHLPVWKEFMVVPLNVYNAMVLGTATLESDMVKVHGSALTESVGGYLAAGIIKQYDVAKPVFTAESTNQSADVKTVTDIISASKIAASMDAMSDIDFGAKMKVSLNASTPVSVGKVTGNVDGSVKSVTNNVNAQVKGIDADVLTASALKADAVNKITAAIWAKVADGTITFEKMSKIILAFTAGKVIITNNSFAFYDQSNVLLFTLPITTSGRIPVIA